MTGMSSLLAEYYVYELLGKNGEPIADQQIVFTFRRTGYDRSQTTALKTDEKKKEKNDGELPSAARAA